MFSSSRIFNSHRPALLLTILALVVSACTGSGSDTTTSVPASTTSTATDTTATTPEPEPAEPEVILIGKTWDEVFESELTTIDSLAQVGDEIWIIGDRYNRSLVLRSADDGETWTSTAISEPVESGTVRMSRVARGPQGRIVGIGSRGTGCDVAIDAEDGYLVVGLCSRFQPMIHISDDGGDSWTQHEPTAISSAGDVVFLNDIAATEDGFMAIGTIRGADWHGAIWSSVDGETWDLTQELRSNGGQTSADRIFIDDNGNVVLLAREHPCSEPFTSGGGWVLGSQWADHVRIYSGMTGEELELQSQNDNPVAPAPADIDCATQDEFEIAELPYPTVTGEILDGKITLLGSNVATPSDADVATHRVIQLADAGWTDVASEFETALERKVLLIDVDVNPGVVITPVNFKPDTGLTTVTSEDSDWTSVESTEPLDIRNVKLAYGHNGTVIVVGTRLFDPEGSQQWPGNPTVAVVFRSIPTSGE